MPKDRDQLTPDEPEDLEKLRHSRGQGTGGTGYDRLPGEDPPGAFQTTEATDEDVTE